MKYDPNQIVFNHDTGKFEDPEKIYFELRKRANNGDKKDTEKASG